MIQKRLEKTPCRVFRMEKTQGYERVLLRLRRSPDCSRCCHHLKTNRHLRFCARGRKTKQHTQSLRLWFQYFVMHLHVKCGILGQIWANAFAWQAIRISCRHSLRMVPSQEHGASRRIASKLSGTKAPISRPSMTVTLGTVDLLCQMAKANITDITSIKTIKTPCMLKHQASGGRDVRYS